MSANSLELLLCGNTAAMISKFPDEKISVLSGLGRLIRSYYDFSFEFKADLSSTQSSYFMPVALRSLMETATIALLARLDPLRVIHSSMCQSNQTYDKSKPQPGALKWKGDVINEAAPAANVWDAALSPSKIPRHLMSEQYKEAFWKPAITNLTNWHTTTTSQSAWVSQLASATPDDAFKTIVGNGKRVYSELSKGIHPEFAVRREAEFDSSTLETYLEDVMKWTATLGLISQFAGGLYSCVPAEDAYAATKTIEDAVNA